MMEDLLKKMDEYAMMWRVPVIRAAEREFLVGVVKTASPRSVLEIGTAIGYSTLLVAAHSDAAVRVTTLELDGERAAVARDFINQSPWSKRVEILVGDAAESITALSGRYDFVFIDAAKGQYLKYLRLIEPLLLDGAVVVADNVLFRGYVRGLAVTPRRYRTIVKRLNAYLDFVTQSPQWHTDIYEAGDGMAVSYYRRSKFEKT